MADPLIEVQYNSYTIPDRIEQHRESFDYDQGQYTLEVDFFLTAASAATLVTDRQTAETALNENSKALTVKYGPTTSQTTMRTFDPAVRSGLMIRTTLQKRGSLLDSDKSIRYTFSVRVRLPADQTDDTGRRRASYTLEYTEARRRRITFTGEYTAIAATGAKATYEANVDAWITSVYTLLGLTEADFETISEAVNARDDEDAELDFTIIDQQVLFPEDATGSYSSPNSLAGIRNATTSFTRRSDNTQVAQRTKGSFRLDVSYSASLNSSSLSPQLIDTTWKTTIKPHLIKQATEEWGGTLQAVESENVSADMTGNVLSAQMTLLLSGGSSGLMLFEQTIEITRDPGNQRIKLLDGIPYTYLFWTLGGEITAVLTINKMQVGSSPASPSGTKDTTKGQLNNNPAALKLIAPSAGNGAWVEQPQTIRDTPTIIGVDQDGKGQSVEIHRTTYTRNYVWAVKAEVGRGTVESRNNIQQQATDASSTDKSTGSTKKPKAAFDVFIYIPGEPLDERFFG